MDSPLESPKDSEEKNNALRIPKSPSSNLPPRTGSYNQSDGNIPHLLKTSATTKRETSPLRVSDTKNIGVSSDEPSSSHSRAVSHPLPSQAYDPQSYNSTPESPLAGKNMAKSSTSTTTATTKKKENKSGSKVPGSGVHRLYSLSMENLKGTPSPLGSEQDLSQALVSIDSDITSFFQSLHHNFDKMERDIHDKRAILRNEEHIALVKSFAELKIYLNTGGYVPESNAQNFQTKKGWWVKMIKFLSSKN